MLRRHTSRSTPWLVGFALLLLTGGDGEATTQKLCPPLQATLWPPPGEVPANAVFVLTVVGDQAKNLGLSATDCPFQLRSQGPGSDQDQDQSQAERICLDVDRVLTEDRDFRQLLLVPRRPLEPGSRYQPEVSKPLLDRLPPRLGEVLVQRLSGRSWHAGAEDTEAPLWQTEPEVVDTLVSRDGLRAPFGARLGFHIPESEAGPLLVRARVSELRTSEAGSKEASPDATERWLYASHQDAVLDAPHCHGGFRFVRGVDYLIEVEAMDAAGNRSPPVRFGTAFETPSSP